MRRIIRQERREAKFFIQQSIEMPVISDCDTLTKKHATTKSDNFVSRNV